MTRMMRTAQAMAAMLMLAMEAQDETESRGREVGDMR
jgi:hypothetical protein